MNTVIRKLFALVAALSVALPALADLEWAYQSFEEELIEIDPDAPRTVPGSSQSFTQSEIDDPWNPPDWFPEDHALMPEVVAHGAGEGVRACASCHMVAGMGHPESSQLAGLPVAYMLRQMVEFKSGARVDRYWMNRIADAMSDEDILPALEYFAALEMIDWVEVVESDTVPRNYIGDGRMRHEHPDGGTEPLGNRILEFPQDRELVTAQHPYTGFLAYAPIGSIARGEELATTGGDGRTIPCSICHGTDLMGLGDVPGIAGSSPLYVVRQLNDLKAGVRNGSQAILMQATVQNLSEEDIVALAAYLASLDP